MIKTLSPYWLDIPFVSPLTALTCTEFTLQVFVWSGLKSAPPALSSWQITKKNPTGSIGDSRINIANILSDFIQFTPQQGTVTGLLNGNNQRWVKWCVFYTTTNPTDYITPSLIDTKLMVKGFNLGLEAENKETPTNKLLLNGREFKVSRSGFFTLPIEIDEPAEVAGDITLDSIVYVINGSVSSDIDIYYTISLGAPTNVTIQTSPFGAGVWSDLYTVPNVSPILNKTITYPLDGSTDIRVVFLDGGDLKVSNVVNIGSV